MPNKAKVRIFTKDTMLADTKDIITTLNKKHNIIALSVIPVNTGSTISELGTVNVKDVNNVDNQEKLLRV